jgi:hypothetical protein
MLANYKFFIGHDINWDPSTEKSFLGNIYTIRLWGSAISASDVLT